MLLTCFSSATFLGCFTFLQSSGITGLCIPLTILLFNSSTCRSFCSQASGGLPQARKLDIKVVAYWFRHLHYPQDRKFNVYLCGSAMLLAPVPQPSYHLNSLHWIEGCYIAFYGLFLFRAHLLWCLSLYIIFSTVSALCIIYTLFNI